MENRPNVVVVIPVCLDENNILTSVLAIRRGAGCLNEVGKFVFPSGFLGPKEKLCEAAQRLMFEETGYTELKGSFIHYMVVDNDIEGDNSIVHRFILPLSEKSVFEKIGTNEINISSSVRGRADDEVSEIRVIKLPEISNHSWAFSHDKIVKDGDFEKIREILGSKD